jgi:hypothetical protein
LNTDFIASLPCAAGRPLLLILNETNVDRSREDGQTAQMVAHPFRERSAWRAAVARQNRLRRNFRAHHALPWQPPAVSQAGAISAGSDASRLVAPESFSSISVASPRGIAGTDRQPTVTKHANARLQLG